MNNKYLSRLSLNYYSLITQIIIINLFTALIGFIFVCFFNLFFLNNNKNIKFKIDQITEQVNNITNHLEENAIFRIRQINEDTGEITFSEPQLDPHASQLYIEKKHLNQPNEIKIFNTNIIKFVDTKNLYVADDVIEVGIDEDYKKVNFFNKYKDFYLNLFNKFQHYFDEHKMKDIIEPFTDDINLINETIKKQKKVIKIFSYENNSLSFNILDPLVLNKNVYGVVLIRGFLTKKSSEPALASFNLFNLYLIIIFFMFLLSIIFTRSIIRPIKTLSSLVKFEKDKFQSTNNKLKYPLRNDEIGGLSNNIQEMSKELKSQINELENFSADVAHELKNPLASLKTSNELLAENKIKLVDRKLLFSNIIKDLDRMNRLISDISDYTKTQVEVEKQKFDKFELINFINDLVLPFVQNNKKIKILFCHNDSKIIVQTNMDKLAQVFINIIENAISFSPQESNILIKQVTENNKAIIYIVDQGLGINEKLKDKIFERFYTDRDDKKNYHTGLGLSISRKIMESLGGSLELSKNMEENYLGACFKLKLPIKA